MNPNPQKSPNAENPASAKSFGAAQEEKLLQFWRENNIFQKTLEKDSPNGDYHFFEGPPTANGRPGIHHVGARSFKDIIPRYKTMQGFSVRRKAGWDTHGLPVELQVEKALGLKSKKEIEEYGVAEFNKKCKESVWTYKEEWEKLTERMGFWLDMKNPYVTYKNSYIEALWSVVKRADERGHLYKDFRVGPWCTRCGTTLSSHELNQPGAYKDVKDLSVYVKFKVKNQENTYLIAWTTTPWTLPGNVALAVGKEIVYLKIKLPSSGDIVFIAKDIIQKNCLIVTSEQATFVFGESFTSKDIIGEITGSDLVGMQYEPLYPFLKDLISADQKEKLANAYQVYAADFVTTTDGTGIVHTAVMYGAEDFELGTRVGLPKFHTVNEEGKFIKGTGFLEGRYVKETDENGKPTLAVDIINDLTARNLLFKKENYTHSYPHCWRCDTPLLYYARTSWYFNMSKLRDQLLKANEKINWEPDHIKEGRFGEWLDGIKDWAISRDRYWGTPLPVWSTESGKKVVIGSIDELRKHSKTGITKIIMVRHGQSENNVMVVSSSHRDKYPLTELGQSQAEQSAGILMKEHVDVVYASPILRARQTAEAYTKLSGHEIVSDDRLGEIMSGDWEEKTATDPDVQGERDEYKALDIDDRYHAKRGQTGESWADLDVRVKNFLDEVIEKHTGKTIVCFAHQGTNAAAIKHLQGMTNRDAVFKVYEQLKNGEISPVYVDTKRKLEFDMHKPFIDDIELELDGEPLKRTPEVMDVWFDSGCMPIAQDHKLGEAVNFNPMPADYIAEGVDQTRGWFYTMHAIANMLHDDPTVAYKNVICMGLLMDANGQKMSKSRGNVVDPWAMFDKYGADVVRFWFYSVNAPGESKNFDEKGLDEVNKKVFNPLRNVVSFYEMYQGEESRIKNQESNEQPAPQNVLDQWIVALWNKTLKIVTEGLDNYQPLEPARALREFIGELSTWYIRRSRDRFKDGDVEALATTHYILTELAKTMAPFTPFIAEEVWQKVTRMRHPREGGDPVESVHLEDFPKSSLINEIVLKNMGQVRALVTMGLEARAKANIKVRQPLAKLSVPSHYSLLTTHYLSIIQDELNVEEIAFEESLQDAVILDTEITDDLRDEGDMRELVRKIQDMRKEANFEPKDRVAVSLSDNEPAWFGKFKGELLASVGAENVAWGNEVEKVEKI